MERGAHRSLLSSGEVNNSGSFTATPLIRLHGTVFRHRDSIKLETTATKSSQCESTLKCRTEVNNVGPSEHV
jgi:hypothetical protein